MKRALLVFPLICFVSLGTAVVAADLKVGSAAPPLSIATWVEGKPVDLSQAKADEVFVVEFWATWCGPCLAGIPHLSELQEHFKKRKVTFVGVSDESASKVKKFLDNGWDAKMRYTVAIDKERKTNNDWMRAAGQNGIPTAFVVKAGKIQWIGHPMNGLDLKVAELCGDTNYAKEAKQLNDLREALQASIKAENWKDMVANADKLLALRPSEERLKLFKYYVLAIKLEDKAAAAKWGQEVIDKCENVQTLNEFAWVTLTDDEFSKHRDLKLSTAAAKKAVDLSKEKEASVLDTYARALADSGDLDAAILWQKKALAACGDDERMRKGIQETLESYEKRAKEG